MEAELREKRNKYIEIREKQVLKVLKYMKSMKSVMVGRITIVFLKWGGENMVKWRRRLVQP